MAAIKKYIILDIDGVFNPFMGTNLPSKGYTLYRKVWISWALNVALHVPMLRRLEEHADVIWGSNWGAESNALAGWLHMKECNYPHIPMSYGTTSNPDETWKLESISSWVEMNTNSEDLIVWVDDELHADAFEWAEQRGNVLVIKTDPAVGLTEAEADKAVQFLQ